MEELTHPAKTVSRPLGSRRTKRLREILVKEDVKRELDKYKTETKYNKKMLSVLCDGELGYTYVEMLSFMREVERDMIGNVDDLWNMVPPSLCSNHTGSKEDLLRQLGLL